MPEHPTLDVDGPAAPPRANGELLFDAPWQSRVFGLTLALCDRGAFAWPEFQRRLIEAIGEWERDHPPGAEYRYYDCWLVALERLIAAKGICAADEIAARTRAYAERPAGHDHTHSHD